MGKKIRPPPLFLRPPQGSYRHLLRPPAPSSPASRSPLPPRAFRSQPPPQPPPSVRFSYPFSTTSIPPCNERKRSIPTKQSQTAAQSNSSCVDFASKSYLGIGKSVIYKCYYLWEKKADAFLGNSSLQDLLKLYGDLSPETTRRFWRISALSPEDFLEILLGFGTDFVVLKKVEFLWKLFRWAEKQSVNFHHLPRSYEIMVSMLARALMLEDAESLLLAAEKRNVFACPIGLFSEVIEGYAKARNLDNAMALFGKARELGIFPSSLCYLSLLNLLIAKGKTNSAVRVYIDMVEVGLGSCSEDHILDFVVVVLTNDGKILEAVNLLRQLRGCGVKVSDKALSAIAVGFCRKKDFDDLLNHLEEWNHVPGACICNKIVSTLCRDLSTEEAWLFMQRMLVSGFSPDATTFSILICQSCKERKLRDGFIYLAECYSRSLIPNLCAYNAIIAGVFRVGLHEYAKDIFEDMVEKGLVPDLTTFRSLLAGYCRCKKFDEVKEVLVKMMNFGLISSTPVDDTLAKALSILGLSRLQVKVKRDNSVGIPRSEFFDSLGNGLYLDTDIDEYDTSLSGILDNAIFPKFDSMLMKHCDHGDIEAALRLKVEVLQWGQNLSLSACSRFLKILCLSPLHTNDAISFLDEMPELLDQLDGQTLNLVIRTLSENGRLANAMFTLERLLKGHLVVESATYTAIVNGFCKERDVSGLGGFWDLAARSMWSPGSKDIILLITNLCKRKLIREVLELLDKIMEHYPELVLTACNALLRDLCMTGYTGVGCTLVEEIIQRNLILDHAAYVKLIKGFLNEQKFAEAFGIFHILREKNMMMPCANVCLLLLPSLIRFNMIDEAIILKHYVIARIPESHNSMCNTLLNEFSRMGKMKDAIHQLQEMLESGFFPDDNALNAMLLGYCLEDNLAKACETLCAMIRRHIRLSISCYRALVRTMLANSKFLGALRVKELIQGKSKSVDRMLYNILIFHLFQAGKSSTVESVLKIMQDKCIFPDKSTYDILVYGFHKCGDVLKSIEALSAIISKGLRPSSRSLRIVICHLCNHGNLDGAIELSKIMQLNGWKHGSVVQNALLGSYLARGWLLEADLLLHQLDKKGLIPNSINYNILIKQFCLHGGMNEAVNLLNVMLKKGNIPNEMSYSSVIQGLCLWKAFDLGLDLHAEMLHKNLHLSEESCDVLVCSLCDEGRTDDARAVLQSMFQLGSFPTYNMYNYVLDSYYLNNNLEKASELLHEMQKAGYAPKFETHWSLISNLSSFGNEDNDNDKNILPGILSLDSSKIKDFKEKGASSFKKRYFTM